MEDQNGEFEDNLDPLSDELSELSTLDVLSEEGFIANPVDHESEAMFLACMLQEGDSSGGEVARLEPEDFDKYRDLAEVMLGLANDGYTVDLETVEHEYGPVPEDILDRSPAPENANVFAEDVRYVARKRRAVQRLAILAMQAQNGSTPDELAKLTEETALKLASDSGATQINLIREYTDDAIDRMREEDEKRVTGIPSNIKALNRITKGFHDNELTYIAGRPSMGKSSLALGIGRHAAKQGYTVGYISAEQRPEPLTERLIKQEGKVDMSINPQKLSHEQKWNRAKQAKETLDRLPFYMTEESGMDIFELKALINRLVVQHDCDMVFFDYFQLLTKPEGTFNRKNQWMGAASRQLKGVAKKLQIPLVVCAQLNRSVESRGGARRPKLSDLREAGQMEEDADMVIFVYRAEKYGITVDDAGNSTEGKAELIVEKNRNGSVGTAHTSFVEPFTLFEDLSSRVHENVEMSQSNTVDENDSSSGSTGTSGPQTSGDGAPYDPSGADF